jgi:hypothetical protein
LKQVKHSFFCDDEHDDLALEINGVQLAIENSSLSPHKLATFDNHNSVSTSLDALATQRKMTDRPTINGDLTLKSVMKTMRELRKEKEIENYGHYRTASVCWREMMTPTIASLANKRETHKKESKLRWHCDTP